ncbi:MAG: DinB family protein [Flavobacterium sp.]|jgi:hypothetical protein|uniref:DinB family protein n=1 Tax=Flavobacterium sp. TaxID=239 RepID=UPI0022C3C7CC|nr:DinB family protein [Flavobacterium sp.]MCZ8297794.1 DinB family protein [Flavobacterium sp.]
MNRKAENIFIQIEQIKYSLITRLNEIDSALLQKNTNDKNWSIVQIVSHLEKIESGTLIYIEKKIGADSSIKGSRLAVRIKGLMLRLSQRLPFKYKTNRSLEENSDSVSYQDVKTKWSETREKMKIILDRLSEEQLNAPLYKNYAVGYISILEQMNFLLVHLQRHIKQIDKLIKINNEN